MDTQLIIELAQGLGYPLAVTIYFMARVEKAMKNVTEAVKDCPKKKD